MVQEKDIGRRYKGAAEKADRRNRSDQSTGEVALTPTEAAGALIQTTVTGIGDVDQDAIRRIQEKMRDADNDVAPIFVELKVGQYIEDAILTRIGSTELDSLNPEKRRRGETDTVATYNFRLKSGEVVSFTGGAQLDRELTGKVGHRVTIARAAKTETRKGHQLNQYAIVVSRYPVERIAPRLAAAAAEDLIGDEDPPRMRGNG